VLDGSNQVIAMVLRFARYPRNYCGQKSYKKRHLSIKIVI